MSFIPALLTGLGTLGGLFGNRDQRQTSTQQSTGATQNVSNAQVAPVYDEGAGTLRDTIISQYLNQIQGLPADLTGYSNRVTSDINKLAGIQGRNVEENLASRGVYGPAAATALNNVESQRIGNIVGLKRDLPLLERDLRSQLLNQAGSFFSTLPYGTSSTGAQTGFSNSSGTGTQTDSGNMLGGLFGNTANTLAFLYAMGAFGGGRGGSRNIPPFQSRIPLPSSTGGF